ncbi:MAG: type IV pilus secretin PilQ [Chromatiales bacterium]|nr:type IV pilus secretin PilQ [Chromatiales bacterium]
MARGTAQPWLALLVLGLLVLTAGPALAQSGAGANVLQDIQVQSAGGERVELRLVTSGPAAQPLAFTIDNPARIALDLPATSVGLKSRRQDVRLGALDSVLAAESGGRTRVVLNLSRMVPYETRLDGNAVVVSLGASTAGTPAVTFPAATAPSGNAAATPGRRSIQNIDFRRGENGAGRVIVTLSDPGTAVDVRKESGQVVLVFGGTELPEALRKRLDVTDFATPVSTIESSGAANGARIAINARPPYDEFAYQSENVFTVEVAPVTQKAADAPKPTLFDAKRDYAGERLTLSFQDIETRAVLQLLADVSGRNIVVSDTVEGNVTLRLQNVPWDQALDIVLATKGLDMRENGNVIIVGPAAEIAAREKADLESRQEIVELEPLQSEFIRVNYAKAIDLAQLIRGRQRGLTSGGGGGGGAGGGGRNALLSPRGSVGIDERTNTLLIQDVPERISAIRRLVTQLDIPVRQVLIESRIVVVRDNFSRSLGIRWGATAVAENGDDGLIAVTGNGNGANGIVNSAIGNINNNGSPFPVTLPALGDRYNVNLPVANPAGQFALAILDDDYLVDLELSALQAEGRGEVISSPRVITANQKEASIRQGVEIPYQEAASSGATTTQFKEAVLSLTVTPQVTPDDRVILDLRVTKDSVGQTITNERGGQVPSIDTRAVETQVLVNNGQTVVLGGIYETEQAETQRKVPLLGDLPGLGVLFRTTTTTSNKTELLIFVTPKILREGANVY